MHTFLFSVLLEWLFFRNGYRFDENYGNHMTSIHLLCCCCFFRCIWMPYKMIRNALTNQLDKQLDHRMIIWYSLFIVFITYADSISNNTNLNADSQTFCRQRFVCVCATNHEIPSWNVECFCFFLCCFFFCFLFFCSPLWLVKLEVCIVTFFEC